MLCVIFLHYKQNSIVLYIFHPIYYKTKMFNKFETGDQYNKTYFNPYVNNGGTILAIAGENFAIIGADSRLSKENSILTRNQKKLFPLSKYAVMASTGCW